MLCDNSSSYSGDNPKIVIIGAGPAGIAAATHLLSNNFNNVHILEAENRIGGRIRTVNFGKGKIDLGAQWCHGEKNNIVYEYVKHLDLLGTGIYSDKFYHSSRQDVDTEFSKELSETYEAVGSDMEENALKNQTMGEYFSKRYNEIINKKYENNKEKLRIAQDALEFFHLEELGIEGSLSWFDCVASSDYEYCEGNQDLTWKDNGFGIFLDVITKKYPNANETIPVYEKVSLNKEVAHINWDANTTEKHVRILCSDGSVYVADHVIFTPSLGVLKEKHDQLFYPRLPEEKIASIHKIGFGTVFKSFLYYAEPWWKGSKGFLFIWDPKDIEHAKEQFPDGPQLEGRSWITYLYSILVFEEDPNLLQLWFTGRLVPEIEMMPEETFTKGVHFAFEKFLGHIYNITKPTKVVRTKWFNNPHFNGTYSFQTTSSNIEGSECIKKLYAPLITPEGRSVVQFAGEATSLHYFSTVHGAVETGFREANRIIDYYKSNEIK